MAQHFLQSRILPQVGKVLQALAAHPVQHHEALHHRGLVAAPLPLLDPHMLTHAGRNVE